MGTENYDNFNQEDFTYHAADNSIHSETMEKKDPAINQHQDDSSIRHGDTTDYAERTSDRNTYSENNTATTQDADNLTDKEDDDDDFDNDANRRTLDEEKADED